MQFFISSTFQDMMRERDLLHRTIYPVIQEQLHSIGDYATFCDLRWGIDTSQMNSDVSEKHILETCLSEIDSSDYLLIFLGNRYGWRPNKDLIQEEANNHELILEDYEISVTEFEIHYGALRNNNNLKRSKFYFCIPDSESIHEESSSDTENLKRLKQQILQLTEGRVTFYKWHNGKAYTQEGMLLSNKIISDIESLYSDYVNSFLAIPANEQLLRKTHALAVSNSKKFHAKKELLSHLTRVLETKHCVGISGEHGSGKSILLSKLVESCKEKYHTAYFPCGVYEHSSSTQDYYEFLTYVVEKYSGISEHYSMTQNTTSIFSEIDLNKWKEYLIQISEGLNLPILLVIDDIDIMDINRIERLDDLVPYGCHDKIKVVMSWSKSFDFEDECAIISINELSTADKQYIFESTLSQNGKKISTNVINQSVLTKKSNNSLYYNLLAQRAILLDARDYSLINSSNLSGIQAIDNYIMTLLKNAASDSSSLAVEMLELIANRIDRQYCYKIYQLLCSSWKGLREQDIEAVFSACGISYSSMKYHQVLNLVSGLFRRNTDGSIDFVNPSIKDAACKHFGKSEEIIYWRRMICEYLLSLNLNDVFVYQQLPYYCYEINNNSKLIKFIQNRLAKTELTNMVFLAKSMLKVSNDNKCLKRWFGDMCKEALEAGGELDFSSFFLYQIWEELDSASYADECVYIYEQLDLFLQGLYEKYHSILIIDDVIEARLHKAKSEQKLECYQEAISTLDSALHVIVQLLKVKNNSRTHAYYVNAFLLCGEIFFQEGLYSHSIDLLKDAFDYFIDNEDAFAEYHDIVLASVMTILLRTLEQLEDFEQISEIATLIRQNEKRLRCINPLQLLEIYRMLFGIYSNSIYANRNEEACNYYLSVIEDICESDLKYAKNIKTINELVVCYCQLAGIFTKYKNNDNKALLYINRSENLLDSVTESLWTVEMKNAHMANLSNKAAIMTEMGNANDLSPLHQVIRMNSSDPQYIAQLAAQEADSLYKDGCINEAIKVLTKVIPMLSKEEKTLAILKLLFGITQKRIIFAEDTAFLDLKDRLIFAEEHLIATKAIYKLAYSYYPDLVNAYERVIQCLFAINNTDGSFKTYDTIIDSDEIAISSAWIKKENTQQIIELYKEGADIGKEHCEKYGYGEKESNGLRYLTFLCMLIQLVQSDTERRNYILDAIDTVENFLNKYPDIMEFPHFEELVELLQILNKYMSVNCENQNGGDSDSNDVDLDENDYTLDDLWDDFVEDIEDDYEDDLSDEEIDELIASYEKETESLRKDTHQRLEHIRKMIFDCPINQMDSEFLDILDNYHELENEDQDYENPQRTAYFLINFANSHIVEYHEILVFWSPGELVRYMIEEYTGTVAETVLNFSLNQLIECQTYEVGHRMGTSKTEYHTVLVHDNNLQILYNHLSSIIIEDEDITLDQLMEDAETISEIEDIIDFYNDSQENVW